jgi:hypothetical protein
MWIHWFGLVWFGLVWVGLVWFGLVWFGLVWFGLVCFGLVSLRFVWLLFSRDSYKPVNTEVVLTIMWPRGFLLCLIYQFNVEQEHEITDNTKNNWACYVEWSLTIQSLLLN